MGNVKNKTEKTVVKTEEIHKDGAEGSTTALGTESSVAISQQKEGEHVCEGQKPENSGEGTDGSGEDEAPIDLVATYPILHLSHQYKVGEKLPASDPGMVQAWIDAGTAVWRTRKGQPPIAHPMTAEPGLPVQAAGMGSGYGDSLAGKIPKAGIGR